MKDRIILKAIGDFKFGRKGSKTRDIELKQFDLFYQGRSERSDITYDYDHIMRRSSGTTSSSVRHQRVLPYHMIYRRMLFMIKLIIDFIRC